MRLRRRKMRESRRTASTGRGESGGWRRIGTRAKREVMRGIRELRRRYKGVEEESIAVAARAYKAALTPLKLTVREMASGRLEGKFRLQRTKQTVLNQHMLHPDSKQRRNTC